MNIKYISNRISFLFVLACITDVFYNCKKDTVSIHVNTEEFYNSVDQVTKTMVHDIFSPPVASRVYVYPNIAAFEIIAQKDATLNSLSKSIKNFNPIPTANNKEINFEVSAIVAYIEVSKHLIFTKDFINPYQESLYKKWEEENESQFEASRIYGEQVASHINKWMQEDNYNQTRTMPKFLVQTDSLYRWQPTPPNYMSGIEPHWREIRPIFLGSASQFKPKKHPEFSLEKTSVFYKELKEVYDITQEITKKGKDSEEVKIAQFWDCNPYVAQSTGHLMKATKKISPGAHWIGITKIASKKNNLDFKSAVKAYTYTSIGIFDAFISCWDEKYGSNLIRPETLINNHIDENWIPLLQTPPFPEYTSGHSVVSGCASIVLTQIFGEDFNFEDTTELEYGLPVRSFTSFNQAAEEAAISRLYGGIHYRAAIENGLIQGQNIGDFIAQKLQLKNK